MNKKNSVICLIIAMTMLLTLPPVKADEMIEIDDDFSSYAMSRPPEGAWTISKNPVDNVEIIALENGRALKIAKGGNGDVLNTGVSYSLPAPGKDRAVVELSVRPNAALVNAGAMFVMDAQGRAMVCCTLNNAGQLAVYYDAQWNPILQYEAQKWYNLKAEIDLHSDTFDFYIDGKKVVGGQEIRNASDTIGRVDSYNAMVNSALYIKDFKISTVSSGEGVVALQEDLDEILPIDDSENIEVLSENFDQWKLGGLPESDFWQVVENDGSTEVVNIDGKKAVRISKPTNAVRGKQSLDLVMDMARAKTLGKSVVTVEYRFRNDDTSKQLACPYITSSTTAPALTVSLNSSNSSISVNSANDIIVPTYERGRWYLVKFVMDYQTKKYDAYINGERVKTAGSLRSGVSNNFKVMSFYADFAGSVFYVDDITITSSLPMPDPADEVTGITINQDDMSEEYIISKAYINSMLGIKPPVIIDIGDKPIKRFVFRPDAVNHIINWEADITLRGDEQRIKIPHMVFGEFAGRELVFEFDCSDNAAQFFERLGDQSKFQSTGLSCRFTATANGAAVNSLKEPITFKWGECLPPEANRTLSAVIVDQNGGYTPIAAKNDMVAEGVWFKSHRMGDILFVDGSRDFEDVSDSRWSKEYIDIASIRGLLESDGLFMPEQSVTRSEFFMLLQRALDLHDREYDSLYADISEQAPYASAVASLYNAGILERAETGDMLYPDRVLRRDEMAYWAVRAYIHSSGRAEEDLSKFNLEIFGDIGDALPHTADAVGMAYTMQYVGKGDGLFRPGNPVTREVAARVAVALIESLGMLDVDFGFRDMSLIDIFALPYTYRTYQTYIYGNAPSLMNENGAVRENIKYDDGINTRLYIEEQRLIDDDITPEVVRKKYLGRAGADDELVSRLVKAYDWAFLQQKEDGGFPGAPNEEYHSAAFFLEQAGRTMYLWSTSGDPVYQKYLDKYLEPVRKGLEWLASDEHFYGNYNTGLYDVYTHRYFYYGTALLNGAILYNDKQMYDRAKELVEEGISHLSKEGFFPEKGWFDVGYGVVSIGYGLRYMLSCDDKLLCSEIRDAMTIATTYAMTRMDNAGNYDTSDSTRSNNVTLRDKQTPKTVSERNMFNTLLAMSVMSGRGDIVSARDQMAVRQSYLTGPFMENAHNYDLANDRPILDEAARAGGEYVQLCQLEINSLEASSGNATLARLTDLDLETGWGIGRLPHYLELDMGGVHEIGRVNVQFGGYDSKKYKYSIMVSEDGENWSYAAKDILSGAIAENEAAFALTNARYIRVWISMVFPLYQSNLSTVRINEVAVYGINRVQSGAGSGECSAENT